MVGTGGRHRYTAVVGGVLKPPVVIYNIGCGHLLHPTLQHTCVIHKVWSMTATHTQLKYDIIIILKTHPMMVGVIHEKALAAPISYCCLLEEWSSKQV